MISVCCGENVLVSGRPLKSRVPDACKSQPPPQDQRFLPQVFGVYTDTGIAVPAGQCLAFAEILAVATALRRVRL
jgi:hypothetical protein